MIDISHIITPTKEEILFVIEGMRNPMNSWDQIDSELWQNNYGEIVFAFGEKDEDLMRRLMKAGPDERKFMRQMPIMMRITAPMYWWKEFDTYKVGTVRNSCSTMHKITEKKFEMADFSTEHLLPASYQALGFTIKTLNEYRDIWLGYDGFKDEHHLGKASEPAPDKKEIWWQLIQLLPSSYNQTANVTLNYEVARNMYWARQNHKLDEWRTFCEALEGIPYSFLITEPAKTGGK